jgi:hypothetical protein
MFSKVECTLSMMTTGMQPFRVESYEDDTTYDVLGDT